MVRKTIKNYKRMAKSWERGYIKDDKHIEEIIRETWWFMCFPIYSREFIHKSSI